MRIENNVKGFIVGLWFVGQSIGKVNGLGFMMHCMSR